MIADYLYFGGVSPTTVGVTMNSLEPYNKVAECINACNPAPAKPKKKKEDTMSRYYDEDLDTYVDTSALTDAERTRIYLKGRVDDMRWNKVKDLEIKFGIRGEDAPETFNEAIQRIKDGKFTMNLKDGDKSIYSPLSYVVWKDPSVKEDQKGFAAARDAYDKAQQDAYDTIMVSDATAGLAAVKELESWTYTAS